MTWRESNPADTVAAPVRAALDGIVLRGATAFLLAVFAVLPVDVPIGDRGLRILAYHGLPALLAGYLVLRCVRVARSRGASDPDAWSRAGELAPGSVRFARAIATFVPLAFLAAGFVLLWPHVLDPDDRARVVGFFVPIFGLLWTATAIAWFDECREVLTAAARDSDALFRAYWSGVAG